MKSIVNIEALSKVYGSGHQALSRVDLAINEGEILALLGPNGAGKTTLISIICGIVSASTGSVSVAGYDIVSDYRQTRDLIGLVPQELTLGAFDTVWNTVNFSRGLFGKSADPAYLEQLLKDLSLWDKRDNELRELSGGMKRRVLIAKALVHSPPVLILDDIGYVKKDDYETSVLFELICQRYETSSLIITANQPFGEWDNIFTDSMMAVAAIDRLVHHATIISIEGESYRVKSKGQKE